MSSFISVRSQPYENCIIVYLCTIVMCLHFMKLVFFKYSDRNNNITWILNGKIYEINKSVSLQIVECVQIKLLLVQGII